MGFDKRNDRRTLFQFLDGAIGSITIYHLKRYLKSFNSLMVRLVANLTITASGLIILFQFLDGAIGR